MPLSLRLIGLSANPTRKGRDMTEKQRLTDDEMDFLLRLLSGKKLQIADRKQDKVRQRMRRSGFAEVVMNPRRWVITEAGKSALLAQREKEQ